MPDPKPVDVELKTVPERTPLFRYGAIATVLYLVALAIFVIKLESSIFELKPNELGDFLAGIFSPLAFLWLVLGFLQQGQELRIQAIELNNSVEQSRQLVQVTRDQLDHEVERTGAEHEERLRARMPALALVRAGGMISGGEHHFSFRLINSGAPCTNVRLGASQGGGEHRGSRGAPLLKSEGKLEFKFKYDNREIVDFDVLVEFTDSSGRDGRCVFLIKAEVDSGRADLKAPGLPTETLLIQ